MLKSALDVALLGGIYTKNYTSEHLKMPQKAAYYSMRLARGNTMNIARQYITYVFPITLHNEKQQSYRE